MINGLQLYKTKWHSGMTQQNHLSSAYLTEPELISTVVDRIWGMQGMNPLSYLTSGMGRKKELINREYTWKLQGEDEKAIAIVESIASGTPGKYLQAFSIKLAEKWFARQDVLVFDDRTYRVRVMEDPYFDSNGWVYTVRLTGSDKTKYVPLALLAAGKQLSKEYMTVPEFSTGGNTTFSSPFAMRNHLTTLRKSYTVTRSAATDVLVIELKNPETNEKTNLWTRYAEWEAMSQWAREIERSLIYSEYSADAKGVTDMIGDNNLPVYEGAGLREQIAPANKRYYTTLTETIIRDFLIDLSYNVLPESSRNFVAFTGEYGFAEFDNALKAAAASWQLVDSVFLTGKGQELTLGGQFKTYLGLNGTKLTLKHLPLYDNVVSQRQLHYQTGRPIESYRFTIMDFGMTGGESNIMKVYKKDSENIMWHVAGSIGPFGDVAKSIGTMRSNELDGYSVNFVSEIGIMMKNPLACGELICTAVK